ncbi:P-loop containing nucleoside triphosphate hydrolase protein [Lasiosphaeria hispida]|uniref:P-loop containing nucleoside triphosphate hydrolase protein n=1 Tax=Lasiosphaeria hispida TaxID=260671 RepID=A0AAJ0HLI9_9PEZI|nr:P-loop containing nucleoside triphosphate hydrolase protein [Lasiosphaeria hispida]
MISRVELSENLWKWRYKLQNLGKSGDKTLSDFSSADTEVAIDEKGLASTSGPSKGVELGSSLTVKTLYEGPGGNEGYYDWVDYPPKQLSKSAAKAQDRVAIKVFKVKDKDKPVISGRHSLRYHQIEVQNPLLVAAISEILQKQDIHLDANENAPFSHPFQELYFAYDDITAKYRELEATKGDPPLRPFMLLFIRLLDDIFAETRAKLSQLRANGLVSFKLAWAYFPKKTTVISWGNNCELLCKVEDTGYKAVGMATKVLSIQGKVLRFTGRGFQWEDYEISIPQFAGNRPITDLPAYPLEFFEGRDEVVTRLTARGRKVLDCQGLTYVNYTGIAVFSEGKTVRKHNVDSRILIDVVGYNKHHLAQGVREGTDPQTKQQQLIVGEDASNTMQIRSTGGTANPSQPIDEKAGTTIQRLGEEAQERNRVAMLALEEKEPHLMYMLPTMEGYALKNKIWASFFIEDMRPMVWNDEAYDHLVYDEQQKDLIMSFVENHGAHAALRKRSKAMEDVIAGKGEGLIMLLSGPPGTGKTLMAEAVADRTHKPLFYLQAEDLGVNAAVLGANIKQVFEMATEWDAVILLDEADVFMAERHPQDIARNELVSIFLRELEYFRGIIFLTTNLYSTIDTAFRSRVSLHLLFNSLTPEARMVVWRKFLDRLPPPVIQRVEGAKDEGGVAVDLDAGDIKELAAWQLNGREIKTAVKMARSWCDHKGYDLTLARLENGIKVTSPHASKLVVGETDTSLYD